MQIFIMRHGEAALGKVDTTDIMRPLTRMGHYESNKIAIQLVTHSGSSNIEIILVSPYVRAQQTFFTIHKVLPLHMKYEALILPQLVPHGNAFLTCSYLKYLYKKGVSSILIISHLPLIQSLLNILCPQQEVPSIFITSSIACIEYDIYHANGKLDWLISPKKE